MDSKKQIVKLEKISSETIKYGGSASWFFLIVGFFFFVIPGIILYFLLRASTTVIHYTATYDDGSVVSGKMGVEKFSKLQAKVNQHKNTGEDSLVRESDLGDSQIKTSSGLPVILCFLFVVGLLASIAIPTFNQFQEKVRLAEEKQKKKKYKKSYKKRKKRRPASPQSK